MDKLLDGKKLADKLNSELKEKITILKKKTGISPKLATILVGENPASKVYVNIKHKTCAEVGIESLMVNLAENTTKEMLLTEIKKLNQDKSVHGILLQIPLPTNLSDATSEFLDAIAPLKDIDGFSAVNRGKLFDYDEYLAPCTPKGIVILLEHYKVDLKGKHVVIVNRSNLVGKPLIFMFLKRNATVTICHTSTQNIESYLRNSDVLIVAVGRPNFLKKENIKEGAIIVDVGTNRSPNGKLIGDVDFNDIFEKCGAISPVPGGVGPMTVCMLMQNTIAAYQKLLNLL